MKNKLLLLIAFAAVGCGPSGPGLDVAVGIDTSGSARQLLAGFVETTATVGAQLDHQLDLFSVYRFDYSPYEVFSGPAPDDYDGFVAKLVDSVHTSATRNGTRPAHMMAQLAAAIARTADPRKKVLVMFTDGGNDDGTAEGKQVGRQAAKALAEDARVVKVIFAGVVTGERETVRSLFAPLGEKLEICEISQVQQEVLNCAS